VPDALFALGFKLFGPSLLGPRLLEALVGTFVAAAVGRATGALTRSREAGRLALAVACVYPFFIYYGGMLLSETSYLALIVPALALLGLGLRDESAPAFAAGGFLLGLAALSRAEAAPIGLLVLATAAAAAKKLDARALRGLALAALCWAAPILLWRAYHRVLDSHGGITLLIGTEYIEENEIDTREAQRAFDASELAGRVRDLTGAERDRVLMHEAFAWMAAHPGATARGWAIKAVNFWRFYPRPNKVYEPNARIANPSGGLSRSALILVSLLFEPALILGGLAGLWTLRRRRELWPQWAFILGTMGIHVFFVSQMRYRLPVMPALILGAAALIFPAKGREHD
jgi:4-amino-4-deoxy-L-arabinose transferase-like glycosyltransferase